METDVYPWPMAHGPSHKALATPAKMGYNKTP